MKLLHSSARLLILLFATIIAVSCHNAPADIPFPVSDKGYPQPVGKPLAFSASKKLSWITVRTGRLKPVIKKFDFNDLPSAPSDSSGFEPFPEPPFETHFNFDSLPSASFNLDSIPSIPLHFKTELLPPPVIVRAPRLVPQTGSTLSIYQFDPHDWKDFLGKNIYCFLQDKNGLIWIGTRQGLYRYDGEQMELWGSFSEGITSLFEDGLGRIWYVEMGSMGMGMIDLASGTVSRFREMITSFHRFAKSKILKDDNGDIWVTGTAGLILIDPSHLSVKHLYERPAIPRSQFGIMDIFQDNHRNIWLVTYDKGAFIIDPEKNKISYLNKAAGLLTDSLTNITGDNKGNLWISENINDTAILMAVNLKLGNIIHYYFRDLGYGDALLSDDKNRLWMGTSKGLIVFDPVKGKFKYKYSDPNGDNNYRIVALLQDYNKQIWVGRFYAAGGFVNKNRQLLSVIDDNKQILNLGKSAISTILEDHNGKIWIGTLDNGVEILDEQKNTTRFLNKSNGLSSNANQSIREIDGSIWLVSDSGIEIINEREKIIEHLGAKEGLTQGIKYGVLKDREGNIWISGSGGLDFIDSGQTTVKHACIAEGLSDDDITDIQQDLDGHIWLATLKNGLDIIDPRNGTIVNLNQAVGLRDNGYRLLLPEEKGRMWIGTAIGLYIADTRKSVFTAITKAEGLSGNQIYSLLSHKGSVLAGTNTGVTIITPPTSGKKRAEDTKGNDNEWEIAPMARSEDLVRNDSSWNTNYVTADARYFWGGEDGTIIIKSEIKEENERGATYLTGIDIMDQPQYFLNKPALKDKDTLWGADTFYVKGQKPVIAGFSKTPRLRWDSVTGPHNMPANLRIPYDQNRIQFHYSLADMYRNDSTYYCYILEGADRTWNVFTTKTESQIYSSLPSGEYIFKVRSKVLNGRWGKPASLSFTIAPPWWQTWWAYSLYSICFITAIYFTDRTRRKMLIERERAKTRERELQQAKEIEKAYKQLETAHENLKATQKQLIQSEKMASLGELTAGIAHEIQNPLNFVNNFSEVNNELLAEMKDEMKKGNIDDANAIANSVIDNGQKILNHGKRADAIVKSMMQHSRATTSQKEPTDINALADEYLHLSYHGLRAKDKTYNARLDTDFDSSIGKINIIPQDFGRVLLNLYNNAFYAVNEKRKSAVAGYEPMVSVRTKRTDNKITITVKDNGNGIPQKVVDKIFQPFFTTKPPSVGTGLGLSLSYDIVKAHGGEIKVETKENEGSEFIIELPLK